jgi:hypothetical protein
LVARDAASRVHDRAPDPALEAPLGAELEATADRPRERLLHDVAREVGVPDDRLGDAQELAVALLVEHAERSHRHVTRSGRSHFLYDATNADLL